MIDNVLLALKDQLNSSADLKDIVVVEDISKHDDELANIGNKVVITLLNVEEESTLKTRSPYIKKQISENPTRYDMQKENTPAYLNLYVMISANRSRYENALINISKVIEVFQEKSVLKCMDPNTETEVSFRIELHTIPFEQLSYIWGLLGGKIMPSALYKISVVKIVAKNTKTIKLIDEVNIKSITVD